MSSYKLLQEFETLCSRVRVPAKTAVWLSRCKVRCVPQYVWPCVGLTTRPDLCGDSRMPRDRSPPLALRRTV